jgi:hypothetical protein
MNNIQIISKEEIVENARITTLVGQKIVIGFVKPFSQIAEVLIQPDFISRHKQVRKIYSIDDLVSKINGRKYLGY